LFLDHTTMDLGQLKIRVDLRPDLYKLTLAPEEVDE
jgi:hypothetical protein